MVKIQIEELKGSEIETPWPSPLNAPITKILHKIKGKPGFIHPNKLKMPDNRKNPDKYCKYHLDNGDNTDECFHLKK